MAFLEADGICTTCEQVTRFSSEYDWLRDHFKCEKCGSIPRERALMLSIDDLSRGIRGEYIDVIVSSKLWIFPGTGAGSGSVAEQPADETLSPTLRGPSKAVVPSPPPGSPDRLDAGRRLAACP